MNMTKNDIHPLILKSGSTDLRRQEKTLIKLVNDNYSEGIKENSIYGFCNSYCNTIKLMKINEINSVILMKIKFNKRLSWPEYKKKGENGYTVELTGDNKKKFLKDIGCPVNL